MPCKSELKMSYSLEWKVLQCHCPQHETHVSKLFSNCTMSGSCLPSLHFTNSGLLWKSMQKACLIRGSILQHAPGLNASELVLSCLQNDAQWYYALAKVVSVVTLCTKCVCCNRIWTKVVCCKLAIFSPANCKQRLYKLWAINEGFLKSLEKTHLAPKITQDTKQLWQKKGEWRWEIRFLRMSRHHQFWNCLFCSVEIHCE